MSPTPRRPGQLTPMRRAVAYGVCGLTFCSAILASSMREEMSSFRKMWRRW